MTVHTFMMHQNAEGLLNFEIAQKHDRLHGTRAQHLDSSFNHGSNLELLHYAVQMCEPTCKSGGEEVPCQPLHAVPSQNVSHLQNFLDHGKS